MLSGIRSIYLYALSMLALLACESGEVAAPNQSGGKACYRPGQKPVDQ